MYSKTQRAVLLSGRLSSRLDSMVPFGKIVTTSPGSTSRINSALIVSSAQVSDVIM